MLAPLAVLPSQLDMSKVSAHNFFLKDVYFMKKPSLPINWGFLLTEPWQ